MSHKSSSRGFSGIEAVILIVIAAVLGLGSWWIWKQNHKKQQNAAQQTSQSTDKQATKTQPADPYASWKTSCDEGLKACYRYPSDWVQSQYGGWQNAAGTAYFNFAANNKDQAASSVYIAAIEDLANASQGLKIIGNIDNNIPGYTVYDASVISDNHLSIGQTAQIVTVNPTFSGRGAAKDITFNASPSVKATASITTFDQAKAWFSTPEAQLCLKILQSFKYQ